MQRVDAHMCSTCQTRQESVRFERYVVSGSILRCQRLVFVITMIQQARYFVQPLRECTAHGNIDFLKAATDAEYRNACAYRTRDKRQCRCITRGVMQGTGNTRISIVPMRLHI
jgi:hypothetical protein